MSTAGDPKDTDSTKSDLSRRQILQRLLGLGAAGAAVGAGGAGLAGLLELGCSPKKTPNGKTVVALSPDGKLIQADASQFVPVTLPPSNPDARKGVPGRRWIMVIDLAKCDGCGECMKACSKMHFVPPDRQWIKVLRMPGAGDEGAPFYFPQPCYHCDNPPCTKVCPVDATFKRDDGIVLIDNERCIGCRFCMAACPYSARSFNWGVPTNTAEEEARGYSPEWGYPRKVGTVEKCDFCPDMAAKGMLPACTSHCPMGAIYYGDENEGTVSNTAGEAVNLRELLRKGGAYRHMEELGTEPRVYYLPQRNAKYKAPDEAGGGA